MVKRRHSAACALAWLCLALSLAACDDRARSDVIVFALATAPTMLDPRLASDAASERVNALLYARLVEIDPNGLPRPGIADWTMLDAQRFRITLRAGRDPFWNGVPPTAADVAMTYRSLLQEGFGSPHAGALDMIEDIEAIDDLTVEFRLARPDPRFATRLTIGILPADRAEDPALVRAPMGSGRFRFVAWRDDGGLLIERRRDGQQVALLPVADPTMRSLKLLRGEAQLVQNDLPAELYRHLATHPDIDIDQGPGTTFAYIGFNLQDPVLAQRDVRRAIAHGIDRQAIVRYLFDGRAEAAESVLRPNHWAGVDDLRPNRHDPALARSLLQGLGYTRDHPLQLEYKTSTDPFRLRIAHVLQQQLAEIGIQLRVVSYEWGTFFGDIKAGNFQMYSLAWVGVNTPDILRYAFHSGSLPPAGANRGRYRSARLDALIDAAETATRDDARIAYQAAQRLIHENLVYVPLWYESNVAASRGLNGYRPGTDGNYRALETVTYAGR